MSTTVQLPVPVVRRISEAGDVLQAAHDHDRLRRLALGIEPGESRARAIIELARTDAPSRIRDLEAILGNEATSARLRHLAAMLLGQIDAESARHALLTALETTDQRLVGTIAQSLGRIGERAAFKALAKASKPLTGVPLAQARFALRLIAHRLDLDLPELPEERPDVVPVLPDDARNVELRPANTIEAQVALRSLASEPFGIELNEPTARAIRCGRSQSVLFLNRELGSPPDIRRLLAKKAFAGLVARRSEATELYSTSLIILTTPNADGKGLGVSVYQTNGTLVFVGVAAPRDKALGFELRSVVRRGAFAAHIEGTVAGWAITLSTARVGRLLRDVGRPVGGSADRARKRH